MSAKRKTIVDTRAKATSEEEVGFEKRACLLAVNNKFILRDYT